MSHKSPIESYTAPNREIYSWALGGIALNALICTYGQAMNILIAGLGMKAWIVSLTMMLPRIVDAMVDPFMGHLSDNTHTRWGRRKPFLVLGCLLASVFLFLLWFGSKEWSKLAQIIHLGSLGILFYTSWGLYSMAYTAFGYELTDDYNERSRIASVGGMVTSAVLLLNGGVFWFTLRPLFERGVGATVRDLFSQGMNFGHMNDVLHRAFATVEGAPSDQINGIRWVTAVVIVASVFVVYLMVKNCRERFVAVKTKQHSSIGLALKETFRNRPFVDLMIYKLCQLFGERVFQGMLFFVALYHICHGDKSEVGKWNFLGGVLGSATTLFLLPFLKPLSMRLGKRMGLIITSILALLLLLVQPLILNPRFPFLLLLPMLLLPVLSVLSTTLLNAIIPDICDLDELEHGERREGLFTAVGAFMNKLEISLSLGIVGGLLWLAGVNESSSTQEPWVIKNLLWLAIGPGVFFTACALIASYRFKMTEADVEEVRKKLQARRIAKAASEEETVTPGLAGQG
ncbi:MAG TPA: MFS transporter [Luteolibacter sp.]